MADDKGAAAPPQTFEQVLDAEIAGLKEPDKPAEPKEEPPAEPAKPAEKPPEPPPEPAAAAPDPSAKLRERLALVAREEVRLRNQQAAIDAAKPDLELLGKIRQAGTLLDKVRLIAGNDDEAVAKLFLDMRESYAGGAPAKPEPKPVTAEDIARLVDEKVNGILKARETEATTAEQKRVEEREQGYARSVRGVLVDDPAKYPLASLALAAGEVDNADIVDLMREGFKATGQLPDPATLLAAIEEQQAEKNPQRRKPETKPNGAAAPATGADKQTKEPAKPAPSSLIGDAPVQPAKKLSFDELLAEEAAKEGIRLDA